MAVITVSNDRPRGEDGIPLDWEPGDVILDLYEVIRLPGTNHGYAEGGMGRVNLVRHREWQRDLAVKSVLPARSASARDIEEFTTEAEQWVDKIGLHPNIVACHYVRVLGGVPRVFIEYVDGGTLAKWIDSKRLYEGGPQAALERILDVAIQTAWGLHYVHELGLIHQDVKPLNVMMTADGVPKVTDFGLAGARSVAFEGTEQRPVGETILATWGGMTPAYCSPEQAEIAWKNAAGTPRERCQKLTRRTDIWSWAASVLEMFLGERSWPAGQVAHLGLQRESVEPYLPPLPLAVKDLLSTCLQKRPEDRPHDLMQVAHSLLTIFQEETGQVFPREKPRPEDLLADSCNNRAVSLIDLAKLQAAETRWQEALNVDPHHPEATYNWGLIQWRSGRITDEKLLQQLREVRASTADSARVDSLLGLVHLERADAQTAVELLSKAIEAGTSRAELTSAVALARSMTNESQQLTRIFEGHTDSVLSVAWSPDCRYILSGSGDIVDEPGDDPTRSRDNSLRLWGVSSGKCLRTFEGHTNAVTSVSWSPDGRFALSGSGDQSLRLWEVFSGKCLRTFEGHTDWVTSVSWSPDGQFALSGSNDKTLRLWEVSIRKCLRIFEGHTDGVTSVAWSPDGRFALSASSDSRLRLWEIASGKCLRRFEGHTERVAAVSWSPDGRFALSAGDFDQTLRLWEVSSGKCLRIFEGHLRGMESLSWSPDGRFALSGGGDEKLRLWVVSTGRCLRTLEGHTGFLVSVSWSPDGRCALSASHDKTVRLWVIPFAKHAVPLVTSKAWGVGSTQYHHLLQQVQKALATDPALAAHLLKKARKQPGCSRREDALQLARRLSRSLAHRSFAEGWEKRTFKGHTGQVNSVSWSPDGRFALSGSHDRTLRLWEVSSGHCLRTFEGHQSWVHSVSWSPDGRYALSGSGVSWRGPSPERAYSNVEDPTLRLWDVCSGQCLRTFVGHTDWVRSVSWSPDGRFALSASSDKTLRLWDVSDGQCLHTFEGHTQGVISVSLSPDGRSLLSGSYDNTVRLWEVSSGRCLRTYEGQTDESHSLRVTSVSWNPDGKVALSGGILRLWDVSTGKCVRTFDGDLKWVASVSWSPDGRFALSMAGNKLLLWEVSSAKCLRTFEGHTGSVHSLAWSPDGRFAISGNEDGTLRLWELDWEFEPNQPADWDEGARHFLTTFLIVRTPCADSLVRLGKPSWTEDDFRQLLDKLSCAGYGWLRPEGVRRELDKMAATWQGPPLRFA